MLALTVSLSQVSSVAVAQKEAIDKLEHKLQNIGLSMEEYRANLEKLERTEGELGTKSSLLLSTYTSAVCVFLKYSAPSGCFIVLILHYHQA